MKLDWFAGLEALRALGLDTPALQQQFDVLARSPGRMADVYGQSSQMAGHLAYPLGFERFLRSDRGDGMPGPDPRQCRCRGRYARPYGAPRPYDRIDFGQLLSSRRDAKKLERMLRRNPQVRRQVEALLGGRVRLDQRIDGRIRVQPFRRSVTGMPPAMARVSGALDNIDQRAMGNGQAPFMGAMLDALTSSQRPQGAGPSARNVRSGGGGGGGGANRSVGRSHDSASAVLNDPALTVEDKVTLMIMLIMKKMDKDIERQAQYINGLQQQQGGGGGVPGAGTSGSGAGGDSSPSIDVETMKLKRLIDKRSQMFDMLRQIIDKYNETAKNIIQSIGR